MNWALRILDKAAVKEMEGHCIACLRADRGEIGYIPTVGSIRPRVAPPLYIIKVPSSSSHDSLLHDSFMV